MKNIFSTLFILLLFSILLTITVSGQGTDTGNLAGTVQDINDAVLPGVKITVMNMDTGLTRTAVSNTNGQWTIPVLPIGRYEVIFEADGFKTLKRLNVAVGTTATTVLNEKLGLGEISSEVVVDADSTPLLSTESATTSVQITEKELESIPSTTRSFTHRILSDSGASSDLPSANTNGTGNVSPAINGTRPTSSSVLFNGIDATNITNEGSLAENISPAPETIAEVKVLTSLYDASVGRSGGGNIQLVTRSGGNRFKGTAYFYLQNEKFNSNDFFYNRDGIDRQKARRLEGGFTIGGPIIKDKFFFFGGYQKTKADTAYVPTAQSYVVLPEALAFIEGPRTPENIRRGFQQAIATLGLVNVSNNVRFGPGCIDFSNASGPYNPFTPPCMRANGVGVQLLNLINPVTGDYFIPTVRSNAERLFTTYTAFTNGFNGERLSYVGRLTDRTRQISGGFGNNILVRQRNIVPARFSQDQFTTRLDYRFSEKNTLSGTFFFANFPAYDPFPDFTQVSPTTLKKDDRNRTLAITDTHVFSSNLINETRFGFFYLNNSRKLDESFLADNLTNEALGIYNPASFYEPGDATRRMSRFSGTGNLEDFSIGAPNDIFNKRQQITMTFANNVTYIKNSQTFRFGVEAKRHAFDTNLPEEQGGEFEKFFNFGQLLNSVLVEADTQFGITDKQFRFNDLSFYITDDWKINNKLTLNLGLRWDWFGLPTEKNGRIANFDFERLTNPDDIRSGFIIPDNFKPTGIATIDETVAQMARSGNNHTLKGQDLNNFAPRFGFAFSPFKNSKTVFRGGYGIFFDRPSAAFMNTIYSNYPFLREIEVTSRPYPVIPIREAFGEQNPALSFFNYLPFRVVMLNDSSGRFQLYDNTPGVRSESSGIDFETGQIVTGNPAETLEFRAIDRNLKTPYVQQWNLGIQQQLGGDWVIEARYVGTRGKKLLQAVGFNQPYDLNDPNTPDYIFKRLNDLYQRVLDAPVNPGDPHPTMPLPSGVSERERGRGIVYGALNDALDGVLLNGIRIFDYNLIPSGFFLIPYDIRAPYLGFSSTDAVVLKSNGNSYYHSGQLNVTKRFSGGFQFNASYTFSKSIDYGSTDPGSTTASGSSDTPNFGLVIQGDQRNIESNRGLSDFDRTHRFNTSFIWELPSFGSKSKFFTDWQLSGIGQWQSGTPFSIYASEPEIFSNIDSIGIQEQWLGRFTDRVRRPVPGTPLSLFQVDYNVAYGTGSLFRPGFARPSVISLELLRRQGADPTRQYFNTCQDPDNPDCALISPLGGFGNLGRNVLRGPMQRRFDLSLQKTTKLNERLTLEFKWDIYNVFNFVNFANPNSDLQDETDFGQITRTIGGPRTMQFGVKLRF